MPKKASCNRKTKRWQPFAWDVKYERVVILHCAGKNNIQIAQLTEYTPQHVANILGTDQAIEIMSVVQEAMRKQTLGIPDLLARAAENAAKRIDQVFSDPDIFNKAPLGVVEKGLKLLEGLKHLDKGVSVVNNTFTLPESVATAMVEGLQTANKARELNPISAGELKLLKSA